jgi:hypothetical protein
LSGARALVQKALVTYGDKGLNDAPSGTYKGWTYEIDRSGLPADVAHELDVRRKWDVTVVEDLPQARLVRDEP